MSPEEKSPNFENPETAQDSENPEKVVAGYKPADLLKAPLSTPWPAQIEPEEMTSNNKVKFLVGVGIVLFVLGLLFLVVNIFVSLILFILAVLAIAVSVFAPVK